MNLAIVVLLSGNGIPLLAVILPLSYQVLPSRLNTLTRVPAGNAVVSLIKAVAPSTLNSASCSSSACGL